MVQVTAKKCYKSWYHDDNTSISNTSTVTVSHLVSLLITCYILFCTNLLVQFW